MKQTGKLGGAESTELHCRILEHACVQEDDGGRDKDDGHHNNGDMQGRGAYGDSDTTVPKVLSHLQITINVV